MKIWFINSKYSEYERYLLSPVLVNENEVIEIPSIKGSSFMRKFAHLLWHLHVYIRWNLFGYSFYKKVRKIKEEDVVIFFSVESKESILNIAEWIPSKTRKIVWHWNSFCGKHCFINNLYEDEKTIVGRGIGVVTFDPEDAKIYDIRFVPQFYNFSRKIDNSGSCVIDFFFAGLVKDSYRSEKIEQIKDYLLENRYSTDFLVVNQTDWKGYVGYEEIIRRDSMCRCIVDIPKEHQAGMTLRVMEALALKKKLLTTSVYIKEYDFYRKENIFIWGEDDINEFDTWFREPYKVIPDELLNQYDVRNWLDKILL